MKFRKLFSLAGVMTLAFFAFAIPAQAQFTNVTALVQDPTGAPYSNCSYTVDFVNRSSLPQLPLLAGSQFQTSFSGARCDSFGNLSIRLADNNQVTPNDVVSQWKFSICDQTGKSCFTSQLTITGTSQDISVSLRAAAAPLPGPATNLFPTAPITISPTGDVCNSIIQAMTGAPGGANILLPAGVFTCSLSSYTVPNSGGIYPTQASYRVHGTFSDYPVMSIGLGPVTPTTSTVLKFTGSVPGSGCRFNTLGFGHLELSGVTFQETVNSSVCGILSTNTMIKVHDNTFVGPQIAWITNKATRIQTTGGTNTLKYRLDLGVSTNALGYHYFVYVKNQGATTVTVGGSFANSTLAVPAGTTGVLNLTPLGDGATHIQFSFSTANSGDAMDVIAYSCFILPSNTDTFILGSTGDPNATFAGAWAAQNGATPTITQNQSVDQEPAYDAVLLGGTGQSNDGTVNSVFAGANSTVKDNYFGRVRSAIKLQSEANALSIQNNFVDSFSGSTTQGAIDLAAGAGANNFGNGLYNNIIEVFNYKHGVWIHNTVTALQIAVNTDCYDGADIFLSCIQNDAGAGVFISSGGDGLTPTGTINPGSFGQMITEATPGSSTVITPFGSQMPGLNVIQSTRLTAPASSITFSNIPQTFKNLQIRMTGRVSDAVVFFDTLIRFNGDSGANYDEQILVGINATTTAAANVGLTGITTCILYGANSNRPNTAGSCVIEIPNYSGTTFEKQVSTWLIAADSLAANQAAGMRGGSWRNTAAITSITLADTAGGNFVTGTTATLYGW